MQGRLLLAHSTPCPPFLSSLAGQEVRGDAGGPRRPQQSRPPAPLLEALAAHRRPCEYLSAPRWEGGDGPTAAPSGAPFIAGVKPQGGETQTALGAQGGQHFLTPNAVRLGLKYCCFFFPPSFPFLFPLFPKDTQKKDAACRLRTHSSPCAPSRESSRRQLILGEEGGEKKNTSVLVKILKGGGGNHQLWCKISPFPQSLVQNPLFSLCAQHHAADGGLSVATLLPEGFG